MAFLLVYGVVVLFFVPAGRRGLGWGLFYPPEVEGIQTSALF